MTVARCDYCDTEHGVMTQGLATITHQAQASCSCKDFSLASVAIRGSGDTCHGWRLAGDWRVSAPTSDSACNQNKQLKMVAMTHCVNCSNFAKWCGPYVQSQYSIDG